MGIDGIRSGVTKPLSATNAFQESRMASDIAMGTRDASDLMSKVSKAGDSAKIAGKVGYGGGVAAAALSAVAVGEALVQIAKNPNCFANQAGTLLNGLAGMADGVEDLIEFASKHSKGFDKLLSGNPVLAKALQKIGGPAAIVSGLINLKNSIPDLIDQVKAVKAGKGDVKSLVSSSIGTLSAGLSVVGGALMMTGAGAPVGTALVAVSGVLAVAQYAIDNWDSIKAGAKKVGHAVSDAADSVAHGAQSIWKKATHALGF